MARMFGLFSLPSLADLFWQSATSTVVLVALLAFAVFARVVSWLDRLPLWLSSFVPVPARAMALARPASVLAFLVLVFLIGFRLSDERSDIKQLNRDLAWARWQIDNVQAGADDAERLKLNAERDAGVLKGKAADYVQGRNRNRVCTFDRFDVERLRPIK